jgi:hypothetical protein
MMLSAAVLMRSTLPKLASAPTTKMADSPPPIWNSTSCDVGVRLVTRSMIFPIPKGTDIVMVDEIPSRPTAAVNYNTRQVR